MIPTRALGRAGIEVTQLGLGGEGVLRTYGCEAQAREVIRRALDLGITYFESARAYSGSESYYGLSLGDDRKRIFLTSKSHERSAAGAATHLHTTLANMRTDWLDLWQVHDVRTEEDLDEIFAPGGAIETFDRARRDGKVRFVGITGHEDPQILLQAFDRYDFDTVLLPVNPAEPHFRSFLEDVLPEASGRRMGVIGMKVLCRGLGLRVPGYTSPETWIRYALAQDVSTIVIGCEDPQQVAQNVAAVSAAPLSAEECRVMEGAVARWARQLMYYK